MIKFYLEMKWRVGVRTACHIVARASKFKSKIELEHGELKTDAKSVMAVLLQALTVRDGITIIIEGSDERAASEDIRSLFSYGSAQDCCPVEGCEDTPILLDQAQNSVSYTCARGHGRHMIDRPGYKKISFFRDPLHSR